MPSSLNKITDIWNQTSITLSSFFDDFFLFLSLAGSFLFSSWEKVLSIPIRCSFLWAGVTHQRSKYQTESSILSSKMSSAHRSTDQILGKESVRVQIVQTSQNVTRCTSNFEEAEIFPLCYRISRNKLLSSTCEYDIIHPDRFATGMLCKQLCILC